MTAIVPTDAGMLSGFWKGKFGGAKRDRTADLLHAMQALSQLSYGPIRPLSRRIRQDLLPGVAAY